jgi:VWFA-related protein
VRRAAAVFAVAALAAAIAIAQQPYFETFEVRLHNLEVVVTDAKGKPVRGLAKDDFIVLENGQPQEVTNFSIYDSGTATASATAPETPAPELAGLVPEQAPPRRFVFYVDDMAVRKPARRSLIRNATSLVDQLRDGDLGAVIRPTGLNRVAQNYTADRAAVRKALVEAIESCTLRPHAPGLFELRELQIALENSYTGSDTDPGEVLLGQQPADVENELRYAKTVYARRASDRVRQRLSQLRALVASMAGVEGRKVVVMITSGLPANPGRDAVDTEVGGDRTMTEWARLADFKPLIDEIGRTAAANGVTIYALEPELPFATSVQKSASSKTIGTTDGDGLQVTGAQIMPAQMLQELLHYSGATLTSLTEKTGGKWFRGAGTIDDVFRQVASDLSVYYSLAYRATGTHGKPRKVEVRIRNRPELRVRTRSEVIEKSPETEMADLVAANLLFPRDLNELRIAVTVGKPVREVQLFTMPLDITFPLETLTFLPAANEKYVATIDVHFAVSGLDNTFTTSGARRQNIEISAKQYETRAGVTFRFKSAVQAAAGVSRVAIGVMDSASRLAAFRNVEVTAP